MLKKQKKDSLKRFSPIQKLVGKIYASILPVKVSTLKNAGHKMAIVGYRATLTFMLIFLLY